MRTKRARTGRATASTLVRTLEIDPAYLSRILAKFEQEGLLRRAASETDRRASTLILTPAGRSAFAPLDEHASRRAADLLAPLPLPARAGVVAAMARIEAELAQTHEREPGGTAWTLHPPKPGDIGWVIARHGALYAAEYGLDHRFEALVARVAGAWLAGNDPVRERCWIAEVNGMNAGSVFLVRGDADTAKLRLLIVEPWARGLGIGKALVEACIGFARETKYKQIVLWTNDVLLAARGIYRATGFRLVASQPHNDFGPAMAGEDWELDLT